MLMEDTTVHQARRRSSLVCGEAWESFLYVFRSAMTVASPKGGRNVQSRPLRYCRVMMEGLAAGGQLAVCLRDLAPRRSDRSERWGTIVDGRNRNNCNSKFQVQ